MHHLATRVENYLFKVHSERESSIFSVHAVIQPAEDMVVWTKHQQMTKLRYRTEGVNLILYFECSCSKGFKCLSMLLTI
jgi:hypothetical protein